MNTFLSQRARTSTPVPASDSQSRSGSWVINFALVAFLFQLALWKFGNTALRLPLRIGVYGASLSFLYLIKGQTTHPAMRWVRLVVMVLLIEVLNPHGSRLIGRVAQVALYLAVLAPLIWVPRLDIRFATFRRVAMILWAFYTASGVVGALQVAYPGQFMGAISENYDEFALAQNTFSLANGTKVIRPMGLTDVPGGAGVAGVNSIILGMGLLLAESRVLLRVAASCGMGVGLFCIYICQGRTNLIIVGIAALSLLALLFYRGCRKQCWLLIAVAGGVALVGTSAAFATGGASTVNRFATLVADDPYTVAYKNRGQFLDQMYSQDLIKYPVGAGLGRWGMMNSYFGGSSDALWAETMWQALLYDGGVALIAGYAALLIALLNANWQVATTALSDGVGVWGCVVFGYTVAALAASFVFPIFSLQLGLEVFLINGCIFAAHRTERVYRI